MDAMESKGTGRAAGFVDLSLEYTDYNRFMERCANASMLLGVDGRHAFDFYRLSDMDHHAPAPFEYLIAQISNMKMDNPDTIVEIVVMVEPGKERCVAFLAAISAHAARFGTEVSFIKMLEDSVELIPATENTMYIRADYTDFNQEHRVLRDLHKGDVVVDALVVARTSDQIHHVIRNITQAALISESLITFDESDEQTQVRWCPNVVVMHTDYFNGFDEGIKRLLGLTTKSVTYKSIE